MLKVIQDFRDVLNSKNQAAFEAAVKVLDDENKNVIMLVLEPSAVENADPDITVVAAMPHDLLLRAPKLLVEAAGAVALSLCRSPNCPLHGDHQKPEEKPN